MSALANVPGLAGYLEAKQQNDASTTGNLQKAAMIQGLLAHMQQQQQADQLRTAMSQSGGDVEKALQLALQSGNVAAAHQLAPLVESKRKERERQVLAGGDMNDPEFLRRAGLALGKPEFVTHAERIEKQREADATLASMRSVQPRVIQPDPQEVAQAADQGTPAVAPAVTPGRPGTFGSLMQSEIPTIAQAAKNYQAQMDSAGAKAIPPQHWLDVQKQLQAQEATQLNMREMAKDRRAAAVKPAVTEAPTGLSEQYKNDPEYKKNVDFWAALVKNGGALPPRFAQSGSGKKMMPDILNVVPTLGSGSAKELLAAQAEQVGQRSEARAVGTRSAAVGMAAGEAREMMPILIKTSEDFQRTGYQPINKVIKAFQDNTGSVESRNFGAALNSFVNVYARAVNPTGAATVSDKDHAREILSTADSHEQLVGLLKVLDQEMTAAQNAPKRVRADQRREITGEPEPSHGPAAPLPPKNAKGWNLMIDAKGNKAYVGPNREVEEVR